MNVLDAAYHVAHDFPGGAAALALRMGKSPKTLCNELKAEGSAKLGLIDAVKISGFAGSTQIAQAFAQELGGVFLPLPEMAPTVSIEGLGRTAKEFGELAQRWATSLADGKVNANELRGIEREALELIASVTALVSQAQAIHEAGKPAHLRQVRA